MDLIQYQPACFRNIFSCSADGVTSWPAINAQYPV
jgi:hypothetical protein